LPRFDSDSIPLKDLQAQEAELAAIKAQRAMLASFQSVSINDNVKEPAPTAARPDGPFTMDLCSSSEEEFIPTLGQININRDRSDSPVTSTPVVSSLAETSPPPLEREVMASRPQRSHAPRTVKRVSDAPAKLRATWKGVIPVNTLGSETTRPFEKHMIKPLADYGAFVVRLIVVDFDMLSHDATFAMFGRSEWRTGAAVWIPSNVWPGKSFDVVDVFA
jgi:hypothetical protein